MYCIEFMFFSPKSKLYLLFLTRRKPEHSSVYAEWDYENDLCGFDYIALK